VYLIQYEDGDEEELDLEDPQAKKIVLLYQIIRHLHVRRIMATLPSGKVT